MKYIIRIPVQVLTVDEHGHTTIASSLDMKVEADTQMEAVEKTEAVLNGTASHLKRSAN